MYRKTHHCDSDIVLCQPPNISQEGFHFIESYGNIFDSDLQNDFSLPESNEIGDHSQLLTEEPFFSDLELFEDIRFDPTSFTQVEDLLLPAEKDKFFSNVFWRLDRNNIHDDISINSNSNSSSHFSTVNDSLNSFPESHPSIDHKTHKFEGSQYYYSSESPNESLTTVEKSSDSDLFDQSPGRKVSSPSFLNIDTHIQANKSGRKPKPLKLTEDEKCILRNEGVVIPENVRTLTKTEERHIKQVKRRIKNKLSAAESRKRKRDYLEGLEERVHQTSSLNSELQKRVGELENRNLHLVTTVKRMKTYISSYLPTIPNGNPALFLFIFAFALFSIPSWISVSNVIMQPHVFHQKHASVGSRTLLSQEFSHLQWISVFFHESKDNALSQRIVPKFYDRKLTNFNPLNYPTYQYINRYRVHQQHQGKNVEKHYS